MALDTATVWGKAVADAIKALGIDNSAPVTPTQLELVWATIKQVTIDQLAKSDVAPGSFSNSGGPVVGTGGPVS